MSGYTKGPLEAVYCEHLGSPAYAVAEVRGDFLAVGCTKDDATLYAAAPDMYEALRQARDLFDDDESIRSVIDAALAKANGNEGSEG